tara:strand:- start:701 stop:2506 length:1806 start_codon:yes stop_codon:yes gene_type:complete
MTKTDTAQAPAYPNLAGDEGFNTLQTAVRWSVRSKIMGIAMGMLILFLIISSFSTFRLLHIKHELMDLSRYTIPIIDTVSLMRVYVFKQEIHLQRLFKYYEQVPLKNQKIENESQKYRMLLATVNHLQKKAQQLANDGIANAKISSDADIYRNVLKVLATVIAKYRQVNDHGLDIIAALAKGNAQAARTSQGKLDEEVNDLNEHIETLSHDLGKITSASISAAESHEEDVFWLAVSATGLAVFLGLFFGIATTAKFTGPIRDLSKKMAQVDDGNLSVELMIRSNDEIGQLSSSFNTMIEELRLKAHIEETFGKYVDPRVVEKMISSINPGETEGERRSMTVMFAGIAGIENLNTEIEPEALTKFYNEYLELIGSPLSENQGVLDKFIGTVMMGFWGKPFTGSDEHADLALKTASDLIASKSDIEELLSRHLGKKTNTPKSVLTIGVATGEMIVGNMGSPSSMAFTVMGDVVNNASRLKGASKQFGVPLLCSEETLKAAGDSHHFREVDKILAMGMDSPMGVYEYLPKLPAYEAYKSETLKLYSDGLAAYRSGDWAAARKLWDIFAKIVPGDKAVKIMSARLDKLEIDGAQDWNGVWQMNSK